MTVLKDISLEAKKLAAIFEATGAEVVEMDFLQISNLLLDLYGEDIRGRAFITNDPVYGEMMLRPDFTIPIVDGKKLTKTIIKLYIRICRLVSSLPYITGSIGIFALL